MARLLVVDPILRYEQYGLTPGWAGEEHLVVFPESFALDDLEPELRIADVILTAHYPVPARMIDACPGLRLIAKPGAGFDNIDVAAASRRGVPVTNVAGTRSRSVAEFALFMMCYLAKNAWMEGDPAWQATSSRELGAKTVGIVGLGAVGSLLARFGHGLGMRVVAHTRTPDPAKAPGVPVTFVAKDELLATADYIVLAMPLTEETRHYIDRGALEIVKQGATLINVSRGPTVSTDDLVESLRSGRLLGAGLDVTDPEPLPADHELRSMPNVLIPPHIAGRSNESQAATMDRMRRNVLAVLAGETPPDLVNPPVAPTA